MNSPIPGSAPLRLRASVLTFTDAPGPDGQSGWIYHDDALLTARCGLIESVVPWDVVIRNGDASDAVEHLPGALIMPGFIDAHVHAPQINMMASFGRQLLDWLTQFTFPEEARYADVAYAQTNIERFFETLLANGTTCAMVFATVHEHTAELLFEGARRRQMCLIAGKVLTDRNVPDALHESSAAGLEASVRLIEKWHARDRLRYALTPRFAMTSTPGHLAATGRLLESRPGLYLQTHLAENRHEVEQTRALFPDSLDYVDVYHQHGLCGPRSVFAHGIHLGDRELDQLAQTRSVIAFCPTSNLFLGSGLLDVARLRQHDVPMAVATDVGAGTSFSMLRTLSEGYKVMQLQGQSWHPLEALYAITLGNARALGLDQEIGSLAPGKFADLVVLEPTASPQLEKRLEKSASVSLTDRRALTDHLFALLMLGDDRNISRTYVAGTLVHQRKHTEGNVGG